MMIPQLTRLVLLVQLVEHVPVPLSPAKRGRGHPPQYSDQLFLKALVIMLIQRVTTVHGLLQMLAEDTAEMQTLRALLTEGGHFPSRRMWERRLYAIPTTLPEYIACFGAALVRLIRPWCQSGRAVARDEHGVTRSWGVWHKKHREAGIVPHTSIDTEEQWSKSGWHGWWYGWKLHVAGVVAACWIPLAAYLTEANISDGEVALHLAASLPAEVRFVLGDHHYQTEELQAHCLQTGRILVCSRGNRKKRVDDPGLEVRRVFHKLRSLAIENWNEQFISLFEGHSQVPTKGKTNTQRFVLGAVFLYQLTVWYLFEHGLNMRLGIKAFLKAA